MQRILVLARDITRRLRSEQALQASEQRLRELSESSPDMLALYAPDGTYLEVSGSVRELFGWTPEDLIGTSSYAYFHPEDLATIRATHDAVLERPDPGVATYRLRCRDGSYRWVEVSGRSLTDPDTGEVRAIQCTTRDITRRHEAEAALAAANAALLASNHELDRLAAVASHDLRSPLATARNLLDLVPDRLGRDHDPIVDELVERARGQLARMTESVDALLELARLGRQRLEPQRFPLGGLLAEVLEAIGPELVLADVSVRLTRDATIVGDRRQLRLLLQNLLSNTRHAAGGERPVRVEVAAERLPDGGWSLTVTDDGDGFREPTATGGGDPTRTDLAGTGSRHTGLGFGLATCARIAERHHANLYLDHLATGTRVRLQVPPADARPRATGTLPAHERPATDP